MTLGTNFSSTLKSGNTKKRLLIFCQYVRGIGHLVRSTELARELAYSFEVCLVNGGQPVPALALPSSIWNLCIAPIFRDEESGDLVPSKPFSTLAKCRMAREADLRRFVVDFRPDVIVTEHFPFGLLFESEFESLIKAAKRENPRTKIVSSVRDVVLMLGGGSEDTKTCQMLERWFDLVLVHGDESVIRFSDSFPKIHSVAVPLKYTGYVVRPFNKCATQINKHGVGDQPPIIIASIGGGRVGGELLEVVIDASKLLATQWKHRLKLFAGPFLPPEVDERIRVAALLTSHIDVFEFAPNFHQDLGNATVAVGLAGYNTVLECVAAGISTLSYLLPFRHGDREQELRATRFRQAGLIETLEPSELLPAVVAERIVQLTEERKRPQRTVRLEGAVASRQLLEELVLNGR